MGRNLGPLNISQSYQGLVQISGSNILTDGTGSLISSLDVTASFATNATSASYATNATSASYALTSTSASYAATASQADSASFSIYADNTITTGKNLEATQIDKGTPVYFTGSGTSGNIVGILRADASNPARMPAGGIVGEDIATTAEGVVLLDGYIGDIDTSLFASGDEIFVAVGGGYTNEAPTGSANQIQHLGNVEKSAVNGSGVIQMMGESRGLPNLQTNYLWLGDSNGVPQAVASSSIIPSFDTGSLLVTASAVDATTTYTKGDGSTFTTTINNVTSSISASFATTAISASYAVSASQAQNAVSASYAPGADPFPYTGSAIVSGSRITTGSVEISIVGGSNLGGEKFEVLNSDERLGFNVQGGANFGDTNFSSDDGYVNFVAGERNTITGGQTSFIGGGRENTINNSAENAAIIGANSNTLGASRSTIQASNGSTLTHTGTPQSDLYSAIIGGNNHTLDGYSGSVILGGTNITASANHTVYTPSNIETYDNKVWINPATTLSTGGGNYNVSIGNDGGTVSGNYSTAVGTRQPNVPSIYAAVYGGNILSATNTWATAVGGESNTAGGQYSFAAGGNGNSATGTRASVIGGTGHSNSGLGGAIIGGQNHTISSALQSAIVGGESCTISAGTDATIIGSFGSSITAGTYAYNIFGSLSSTISALSNWSANIIGGSNNTISAAGGNGRILLLGGQSNTISGGSHNSILAGQTNTVSHNHSVVIGGQNLSSTKTDEVTVPNLTISGSAVGEVGVITPSSNTGSMDCSTGNFFTMTLGNAVDTRLEVSNVQTGQTINLKLTNNATAAGTISFGPEFEFSGGTPFVATAVTSSVDVLTFISFDGTSLQTTGVKNFS